LIFRILLSTLRFFHNLLKNFIVNPCGYVQILKFKKDCKDEMLISIMQIFFKFFLIPSFGYHSPYFWGCKGMDKFNIAKFFLFLY